MAILNMITRFIPMWAYIVLVVGVAAYGKGVWDGRAPYKVAEQLRDAKSKAAKKNFEDEKNTSIQNKVLGDEKLKDNLSCYFDGDIVYELRHFR